MGVPVRATRAPTRVLVVQRDEETAEGLAQWLQSDGFEVVSCPGPLAGSPCSLLVHGGCERCAGAAAAIYDPWIAAVDGEPDTAAIVRAIRQHYPDLPVVLTGADLPEELAALVPTDARLCAVAAPITHAKLAAALAKLLPPPGGPGRRPD